MKKVAKRTVTITISSCDECIHTTTRKVYTPDSFEQCRSIHCSLMDEKKITELDWNENVDWIPEWCPLLKKKKK